jgi:hypothetical protein
LLVRAGEDGFWVGQFRDHHVIMADSEDNLRRGVFTLGNTANNLYRQISSEKSEKMAFFGQDTIKCKMAVGNKYLYQIKNFNPYPANVEYRVSS